MLTTEKIIKLRELAYRGEGGEKENAKRILAQNGIDWKKPEEPILNKIKSAFGGTIVKEYGFKIKTLSAPMLLAIILKRIGVKDPTVCIKGAGMYFTSTEAEKNQVAKIFFKNEKSFDEAISDYAYTRVNVF